MLNKENFSILLDKLQAELQSTSSKTREIVLDWLIKIITQHSEIIKDLSRQLLSSLIQTLDYHEENVNINKVMKECFVFSL